MTPSPHLERVPAGLLLVGRVLGLNPLYSSCSFKPWISSCAPGGRQNCLHVIPQYHCTTAVSSVGSRCSLHYRVSVSLAVLYVVYLLLCTRDSVSPQFFRRNCSRTRYRLGVPVEEWSSGSSYVTVLDRRVVYFTVFVLTF